MTSIKTTTVIINYKFRFVTLSVTRAILLRTFSLDQFKNLKGGSRHSFGIAT